MPNFSSPIQFEREPQEKVRLQIGQVCVSLTMEIGFAPLQANAWLSPVNPQKAIVQEKFDVVSHFC
jgi:hypothetical protein